MLISLIGFSCLAQTSNPQNAQAQIVGIWRGNSVCLVPNSPCHDEENIYRISEIAGKPGFFSITGSKIVDGNEIVMGTSEWKYDTKKHTLQSESPFGTFLLTIDGNKMEGSLTKHDKTVYRRIHLTKQT
ncbi:MAG TPA: hypothetical protein VG759_10155 [Candidatus Angelobacter sp.]|nr:hypothetical protein [Candidatus Angelobacter sp.]